ncbi:hypothetical protein [Ectopseudomonas composti]|uniref:hypothetical protein n=1 Tax=Ectopseudomonas composti TaxID=658457 RepID=UPI000AAD45FB|nr:hypothetical protein [Pseudomonas composti]
MLILKDALVALRLIFRAGFSQLAVGLVVVVLLATLLSSYFSGRQLATVGVDVGFSTMRLLLPLLLVLLMQEVLFREFDKRYYLSSLAHPRTRINLLAGRVVAVLVFVLGLLLVLSVLLVCLVEMIGGMYLQSTPVGLGLPYIVTISFFAVDLLVLTSVATLLSVLASTPSFVLIGTLGFMLVARSYGAVVELLSSDSGLVGNAENYRDSLGVLGYLVPDLGALDVRMIMLYGKMEFLPSDWGWLLLSCLSYIIALLALSVCALQRKRFN